MQKIPIIEEPTTYSLVNIVMFPFKWYQAPMITDPMDFFYEVNNIPYTIQIPYMRHHVSTKFSITNEYQACQLPLAGNEPGSFGPLTLFIFSIFSLPNEMSVGEMILKLATDLHDTKKTESIDIFVPSAMLEERIEVHESIFPALLRKNNPILNPIVSENDVTLRLLQINKFCMDKNGATVTEPSPTSSPRQMTFNKSFFIGLADVNTHVPVFLGKVTIGLDANTHSCT
ncbi:hypothetical protein HMI54_007840 [Coelomomyces lativittatus]|nr:hypothetical protein HMI54_007840 [Coelomomyces lativittatus]KAJ1508179.1 hypothetical protein HMI55_000474 [Coelomomyces lativittatus]KAJ1511920.1 hypothetical protein HMI56_004757 [Coelomomyces lativittatus]